MEERGRASAGAIIAAYLAFDRSPEVGKHMVGLLDPERLVSFQDFPLGRKYLGGIPRLAFRHGMAPGTAFEKWFDGVLGGSTFEIVRTGDNWADSRLKLIAADVTNRRLLVLPEDLPRYRMPGTTQPIDPATFPISKAARMSMSIPYFFQAVELDLVVGEDGRPIPPVRSYIVDGGTLSNFPVWLFDSPNPTRPTFGFTLTGGTGVGGGIKKYRKLLPWSARTGFDIFHTAQEAWDVRFQTHSTQVRTLAVSATVQTPRGADGREHDTVQALEGAPGRSRRERPPRGHELPRRVQARGLLQHAPRAARTARAYTACRAGARVAARP